MRRGLDISPVGSWGDPKTMAELAALAERSGWDGVFLEDYVFYPGGLDTFDPWVTLAAIALATERVRIGTLVTPLARRRVWKVAQEVMSLDHLSGGRMVFGAGLGDVGSNDFGAVGELTDPSMLAGRLDESLVVLDALWSGRTVRHRGAHLEIDGVRMWPRPVQRPRPPVWIGGSLNRRGPRRRALRWDGACLYGEPAPGENWRDVTADEVRTLKREAREQRGDDDFVVAVGGRRRQLDLRAERAYLESIEAAGADWWHEHIDPSDRYDDVCALIEEGPVRS